MAGKSRQHKSEKRRKELTRQARQKEKRDRRTDKVRDGGGPPIDWSDSPAGQTESGEAGSTAPPTAPDEPHP